jgi:uncharacterized protein (TIGR02268 family)
LPLPFTLVLALAFLLGTVARAQSSPAHEQRQRSVTVNGNPADPPQEIHVAKNFATVLLFKAWINRDAVKVDGRDTRIKVDAGDSAIILEPLIDLGSAERLVLSVPFADGQLAVFILASHASEVDTRVDVIRRQPPEAACQTEVMELRAQCRAKGPLEFARAGYLDRSGIKTAVVDAYQNEVGGFASDRGVSHRGTGWLLIDVNIANQSGQPWVPQVATLTSKAGTQVTVRAMTADPGEIGPGKSARILMEAEEPPESAGREFVLELGGKDGRSFSIPTVRLAPQEGGKR